MTELWRRASLTLTERNVLQQIGAEATRMLLPGAAELSGRLWGLQVGHKLLWSTQPGWQGEVVESAREAVKV